MAANGTSDTDAAATRDRPGLGVVEKATRFGAGAALGFFAGMVPIARYGVTSFGVAGGVWAVAMASCGYLALRYGDEFWFAIFGRHQ